MDVNEITLCQCVCLCVCIFLVPLRDFYRYKDSSPHGDQNLFIVREDVIDEILVKVWVRLSTVNGGQCNVLTSIAS